MSALTERFAESDIDSQLPGFRGEKIKWEGFCEV